MPEKDRKSLRLQFPEELERQFLDDYFQKSLRSLRLSLLLGAMLYALFGVMDRMIFPEAKAASWFIRYAVVCPFILACILFTHSRHFRKYMQPAVFLTVLVGGAGIIALMVIVKSPINYFHYAGLLLILMYTYTFSKLRFVYTTAASCAVVLMYEIASIWILRTPLPTLLNDNFFYLSALLIGMFSSYNREFYMRKDFLQTKLVSELERKRHVLEREKILRDLHDGLGGITTNIRLLAEMGQESASPEAMKKTLATISELSREGLSEIKGFMHSLDPQEITWQALAGELRSLGGALVKPHGFGFTLSANVGEIADEPGSLLWLNLFRIYKEALTNVVKHSGGKNVAIDLAVSPDRLSLVVRDDGGGIAQWTTGGRGISNMRKRAEEIGGTISFANDGGAVVRLDLPLPFHFRAEA